MDVAYNQHAARRKSRSSTNLNHLTLAPLTSKLPLEADDDETYDPSLTRSTSYLQGKSAPTTPRLLSRSPGASRSSSRARGTSAPGGVRLPKSKSATHLITEPTTPNRHSYNGHLGGGGGRSLNASPTNTRHNPRKGHNNNHHDRSDSDWLLRAGALISTETRESKGQAWLVSRASSTSLAGMHDAEAEAFERELARERELASRTNSRRGSIHDGVVGDDYHHHHHGHSLGSVYSHHSPTHSRLPSRSQSRVGSRSQLLTPSERRSVDGGYFAMTSPAPIGEDDDTSSMFAGPDFVNLDEKLEAAGSFEAENELLAAAASIDEDEAAVRRLVKRGNAGVGAWFGNLVGVQLFAVKEDEEEEEEDDDDDDETEEEGELSSDDGSSSVVSRASRHPQRRFQDITTTSLVNLDERMPPPKEDQGGWHDAAWLLTVASKVLL